MTTPPLPTNNSRALISALVDLAVSTPKTVADMHVVFYGHVRLLDVYIYANGWSEGVPAVFSGKSYLGQDDAAVVETQLRALLANCKDALAAIAIITPEEQRAAKAAAKRAEAKALLAQAEELEKGATP